MENEQQEEPKDSPLMIALGLLFLFGQFLFYALIVVGVIWILWPGTGSDTGCSYWEENMGCDERLME